MNKERVTQDYEIDGYFFHPFLDSGRGIGVYIIDELDDCVSNSKLKLI